MLTIRQAVRSDVDAIVRMLADDALGAQREAYESPLPRSYYAAFDAISADPNNELVVACEGERAIGVLQLTFIPHLTDRGSWRALIEGVRMAADVSTTILFPTQGAGTGRRPVLAA
jgi:hypothetical protein